MDKTYQPGLVEPRIYRWWEEQGYFKPREDAQGAPFVISMPPPNVTGELHLGHALTATMEDIMIRYHRMRGVPTLWVPGSDHAGIATQVMVERELRREGTDRHAIGREAFIKRVWAWKEQYGSRIVEQHRRLGASCDWDRERFTLDAGLSRAVREVFVRLHEEGLIYRDARIINWCPRCASAISDLEVNHQDHAGKLYYVAYPLVPSHGTSVDSQTIVVATTRPETILGDTAVAVHPGDPRYRDLIGREAILPALGRHIPIVADEAVQPEFGTGAVKVTPAHDPTDFEIGNRHNLPRIQVIGFDARMTEEAGPYAGLDRYQARERLLADLEAAGQLVRADDYTIPLGTCQRCGTVIEPLISRQWFVSMKPLAGPALSAVRYGQTRIVPERFAKVYVDWLSNIHDWCISRQLWWGHRIPAWYCANGHTTVAREDPASCAVCGDESLEQDADVLDTWFSSWLWPFSTLGWPEQTPDLDRFYPTSVLESGYDILFFWVARMMMAGIHFTGSVPFHTIYLHGMIRDAKGEKMSKTRGNVVNPLEVMEEYGTDALRFTLATSSAPGNDMKLVKQRIEGNRNFATKIWNAARYVLAQVDGSGRAPVANADLEPASPADRWIVSRLGALIAEVTHLIEEYQFGEAGRQIYDFFWSEYCDWYLEIAKVQLRDADDAARATTFRTLVRVLDSALRLLHPYMPFITEEIYQQLPGHGEALIVAAWPEAALRDLEAERQMGLVIDLIGGIRTARAELNIEPRRQLVALVVAPAHHALLESQRTIIEALATLERMDLRDAPATVPDQSLHLAFPELEAYLPLEGVVDMAAERLRAETEMARIAQAMAGLRARLENPEFTAKAPEAVVEKERARLVENEELLARLQSRVAMLG
jgi:valyl-tRNA synthetase